jgi:hypothetical protein
MGECDGLVFEFVNTGGEELGCRGGTAQPAADVEVGLCEEGSEVDEVHFGLAVHEL